LLLTVRLGDGRDFVFGLPGTTADAGSIVEEKITADSYSFCPMPLPSSAQLSRILPSARLLLKPPVKCRRWNLKAETQRPHQQNPKCSLSCLQKNIAASRH
jgi:hypothetical protein